MPEKISIIRDSGETLSSNIVALFTIPDNEKKYIITTENAVDPHGLTVLHVSEIVDGVLKKIATDEEWSSIKTIMRSIISGSVGSFQFIPMIKTAKAEAQYSRDISVSAAASQQIIDSYAASNPEEGGTESAPVEEPKDTDEITPGISEVVEDEAPAEEVSEEVEQPKVEEEPSVGDAVTNIDASDIVTTPEESTPEADEPAKEEVQEEVVSEPEVAVPAVEEEIVPVEEVVQSTPVEETPVQEVQQVVAEVPMQSVNVQTPVVAYVDPAFQQLLTSDYNQILMHVQNINNNISQIAAMPALNYQPSYSANQNGAPNFNPSATVDEIIMGSTEVFNEGVKNLVATITEKLYRDLYQREAELAKREEMLLEREKMVNEQLAKLGSSAPASVEAVPASVEVTTVQEEPVMEQEQASPEVNVVDASVKVEETVPAQQNTAPVAEPVAEKTEEVKKEEVVEVAAAPVNSVPQPVQTVEII